jgi:hypothetical protein
MLNIENKTYIDGLKTLEDLYFLIDPNLEPILERVLFHFNELKNEAELGSVQSPIKINNLEYISKSFDKYIKDNVQSFLLENGEIDQINYHSQAGELNFLKWDKMISIVKEIFEVFNLFELTKKFDFEISSRGIYGIGFLNQSFNFNKIRLKLKEKIKLFAKNKILLSFEVEESVYDNILILKMFFDFSHDPNLIYSIDIDQEKGNRVFFTNILDNYRVNFEFLENLRKTVFLEITDDFRLKRYNYLPTGSKKKISEKEFFHFHFLFHSISLIIPKKGKILPSRDIDLMNSDSEMYFDRDCGNKAKGKDQDNIIDLFSLISK